MISRVFFFHHTLRQLSADSWICEDIAEYPTMTLGALKESLRRLDESLSEQSVYLKMGKTMFTLGDHTQVALSPNTVKRLTSLRESHPDMYKTVTENKNKLRKALEIIL